MKHLSRILLAAAFLVFGLATAQADIVFPPPPFHLNDGDVALFGGAHGNANGVVDTFNIVPLQPGDLRAQLDSFNPGNLLFTNVQLKDTLGGFLAGIGTIAGADVDLVFAGLLVGHTYDLIVTYNVSGMADGRQAAYHGEAALNAVPLPSSFPLLATGLGILALVFYRRLRAA